MSPDTSLLRDWPYQIWPYARGLYAPDTLGTLWRRMYDDGALSRVFYEAEYPEELETLVSQIAHATLFLVTWEKDLIGAVWFSNLQEKRANVGVWYVRQHQGPKARELTDRVCRYAFQVYGWEYIWACSPWKVAIRHGLLIGFESMGSLPEWVQIREKLMPLHIARRANPCLQSC